MVRKRKGKPHRGGRQAKPEPVSLPGPETEQAAETPDIEPRRPQPRKRPRSGRQLHLYHLLLILVLPCLVAATYWHSREVFAHYQTNLIRSPDLARYTWWSHLTGWMPNGLRSWANRVVVGYKPLPKTKNLAEYIRRLEITEESFPYDSVLQLELARQLFNRFRTSRGVGADRRIEWLEECLDHNRKAFDTYFDVEAYNQMAWTHLELHGQLLLKGSLDEAASELNEAIKEFKRVLLLNPGDVVALERLAYIHASIARARKSEEYWNQTIAYAKRILDEEHDNTNAYYFLGLAYDNLNLKDRAATYLFKALNTPNNLPDERNLWRDEKERIIEHLKKYRYINPDELESKK